MGGTREAAKGKVSEGWVGEASVLGFEIFPPRRKGAALKNLAGALHPETVRYTLSVGRELKTEIPVNS